MRMDFSINSHPIGMYTKEFFKILRFSLQVKLFLYNEEAKIDLK